MKQIVPSEIQAGDEIMVKQVFPDGTKHYALGRVLYYEDEYVTLDTDPDRPLDLHPSVAMPNCLIFR